MLGIGGGRATDGNGGLSESGPAENRALQVQDPRFMLITEHYNIPGGAVGTETIGNGDGGGDDDGDNKSNPEIEIQAHC